ncbi:MAG: hypothetical protein U5P41_07310 [Gammaproteobacteria bacterium]|nr:hypothetical protein [Gammaproteobacteria bacterium]
MKHWTTIEEQILREHFPQAGIPACRELLPGRQRRRNTAARVSNEIKVQNTA